MKKTTKLLTTKYILSNPSCEHKHKLHNPTQNTVIGVQPSNGFTPPTLVVMATKFDTK